jgi:hypothetical protein
MFDESDETLAQTYGEERLGYCSNKKKEVNQMPTCSWADLKSSMLTGRMCSLPYNAGSGLPSAFAKFFSCKQWNGTTQKPKIRTKQIFIESNCNESMKWTVGTGHLPTCQPRKSTQDHNKMSNSILAAKLMHHASFHPATKGYCSQKQKRKTPLHTFFSFSKISRMG